MSKFLTSSALALALVVSASTAQGADLDYERTLELVVSGQIESWTGYMLYGNESGGFDPDEGTDQWVSGQSGRLSLPLGTNLSLQMDGQVEHASLFDSKKDDLFNNSFLLGTHLSWRDPNSFLIGGFGAFGGGNHDDDNTTTPADFYAFGGEFQLYADNVTFYGQGGVLEGSNDVDYLRDAFFGRGVVRWFMTPDSRLQGEFSYVNGETDSIANDTTILEWGIRYDTVLMALPFIGDTTVFVGYRGADFDKSGSDDGGFMDHTVMVGFNTSFGGNTMQEFDRVGATLDLPNFGRWVASGEALE